MHADTQTPAKAEPALPLLVRLRWLALLAQVLTIVATFFTPRIASKQAFSPYGAGATQRKNEVSVPRLDRGANCERAGG